MAKKKPVIMVTVSERNRHQIEIAEAGEKRNYSDIVREAIKEWMQKRGYSWTNDITSHRRKNKYAESLAQYGRNEGFTRERARQIVDQEEEENKGDS